MSDITFLGAAGRSPVPGTCCDDERTARARRLRHVPGSQGPAPAQLARARRARQDLDAVVLTHAHLDHCGWLPRLVAAGYRGRIFCTPGTRDLCTLVLPDAGRIQEEDTKQANKYGYSKHHPALPLYTEDDARRALTLLQPVGSACPCRSRPG